MAARSEDLFEIGTDILTTDIADNGTVTAQTGDVVTKEVGGANAEWWQHVGFASRPARSEPGTAACQAVKLNRGDHDTCIASRDLRGQAIYGNLKDGEACVYAPGAQGKVSFKADGSVTLYTTDDNTPNGNGVYLKLAPDKLQFIAPWGTLTFDETGIHVTTTSGATWDMGSLSPPEPLASLVPNYCTFTCAQFSADAQIVMLGPSTGVFGAVVNTVTPIPPTPVGSIVCAAPASPTVPPMNAATGVFVNCGFTP